MLPAVEAHIDLLGGRGAGPYRTFDCGLGRSDKGDDGPISGGPRVYVEEHYTFDGFDRRCDRPNHLGISTVREIGHAFDEWLVHHVRLSAHPWGDLRRLPSAR